MAAAAVCGELKGAMAVYDAQTSPLSETAMLVVSAKLTSAEVRKVNTEQGKLTIKHEAIENLQLPSMTMVFEVTDRAMQLKNFGAETKSKFATEKANGALVITTVQTAK